MTEKFGVDFMIEREKVGKKDVFIASGLNINVLAEGNTIDEAKEKFISGLNAHLEAFPEERRCLISSEEEKFEMPMISRIFL